MLRLNWKLKEFQDMQTEFNKLLPDSLYMSHYKSNACII